MENSRRCDICDVDIHRERFAKHLRNQKHLKDIKQDDMIIPDWLFQEPVEKKPRKICNPDQFKQIARENINIDDKELNKELAKKMFNPYDFADRALQVRFDITI